MPSAETGLIGLEQILDARAVIAGRVHRTPLVGSSSLGRVARARVGIKLESFQKTGSFKVRGVLNKLHHLSAEERSRGVIAFSAGNHGQALAWAAAEAGVSATVVMPATAVRGKIEATREYGGEVILTEAPLMDATLEIQRARGLTLVHPFDDPLVIAGQGTVGLEILEDVPDLDAVFVGVGGGGLVAGVAAAVKARRPEARVIGVEPRGADAMARSIEAGEPVTLPSTDTIADGLAAPFAGRHTLAHVRALVDEIVTVPDSAIVEALRLLLERCKVLAEPAAAASVAGLLAERGRVVSGAAVVCVLSGGNIDLERLKALL